MNAKRAAKRKAGYRKFLASGTWKRIRRAAIERVGNQCENWLYGKSAVDDWGLVWNTAVRCPKTTRLTVHHLTYARYGGNELPEDLKVFCRGCHDLIEGRKPHKANRRKVA